MPIKSLLISLAIPTIIISNTSSSYVSSEARTEVNGENASAKTEIITNVNGTETRVESNQPGAVKVEVKNGEVKIETSPSISPTITISTPTSVVTGAVFGEVNKVPQNIFSLIKDIVSKIFGIFRFRT